MWLKYAYLVNCEGESQLVIIVVAVADRHQGLIVAVVELVHRLK